MDNENAPDCAIAAATKPPLSQDAAYVPIVSVWAAALLALPLLVMPAAMATALGVGIGLPELSPIALSAIAACLGALVGFGAARSIAAYQSKGDTPTSAPAVQAVGEQIADEPEVQADDEDILVLEETSIEPEVVAQPIPKPTRATNFPPWPDGLEQPSAEIILPEAMPKPAAPVEVAPEAPLAQPIAPPIANISVKFEKPVPATPIGGKAVQQLRGADVADLNMVQLLERFAVALDHHREAVGEAGRGQQIRADGQAGAAQADQQSPVTNFYPDSDIDAPRSGVSTRTRAIETENALRNALSDLDRLSGAA